MINFLCEEAASAGSGATRGIMTALLVVVLIGMLVMPYFSNKKKSKEYEAMINSLKAGDLVKTAGGIIGRINKIIDKGDIKTVVLETGSKTEKSYIEFDMNMIYCVLKSTKVDDSLAEDDDDDDEDDDETEESSEPENSNDVANETENLKTAEEALKEEETKPEEKTENKPSETENNKNNGSAKKTSNASKSNGSKKNYSKKNNSKK